MNHVLMAGIQTSTQEICNSSTHEYILIITHQQTPMQQQWNNVCADNCIQFLWGIHPKPPQADCEVEVETSPSMLEFANSLILYQHSVLAELLDQTSDADFIS